MNSMFAEPARQIPLVEETDIVVCGAGPAGIAAALAAARNGARTRLIETHGCLGGIWTVGLLSWILDHGNKGGIMAELLTELEARNARRYNAYDAEILKLILEEKCAAAGVDVRLHTRVTAAGVDDHRLRVALTESKSGREAWGAKAFIDCSGDGDLAAWAGCGFDLGNPDTGECQPMSLMALLAGVDAHALQDAGFVRVTTDPGDCKKNFLAELNRAGVDPSYHGPTLFSIRDDLIAMMANHQYHVSGLDADQLTRATLEARAEVHKLIDALRALGGVWKNVFIVATGAQIGVREGRRIRGRYTVTIDDLANGARFDDAICRVKFGIDVHSTNPSRDGKAIAPKPVKSQPYDIPLRSLIAKDVDGLLMAGRCISGDFIAHSSYRVTGNSVACGEAAGVCAAVAATSGRLPHEVPFAEVKAKLPET